MQAMFDMQKYWQKQFDQNYTRSLDHRSFYFKSIDKKVLGNRHILSELKEAAEAQASRPEAALVVHAGVPEAIKLLPHLVLDMPSKCVLAS
jgi:histone deacetylase complex regulatory component SIN3